MIISAQVCIVLKLQLTLVLTQPVVVCRPLTVLAYMLVVSWYIATMRGGCVDGALVNIGL